MSESPCIESQVWVKTTPCKKSSSPCSRLSREDLTRWQQFDGRWACTWDILMGVPMRRKGKNPAAWRSSSGTYGQKKPIGFRSFGIWEAISLYPIAAIVSISFWTFRNEVSLSTEVLFPEGIHLNLTQRCEQFQ